jgi:hypothetical protein
VAFCHGCLAVGSEVGADLIDFGQAEFGEQGQCLLPVLASLVTFACGMVGTGGPVRHRRGDAGGGAISWA